MRRLYALVNLMQGHTQQNLECIDIDATAHGHKSLSQCRIAQMAYCRVERCLTRVRKSLKMDLARFMGKEARITGAFIGWRMCGGRRRQSGETRLRTWKRTTGGWSELERVVRCRWHGLERHMRRAFRWSYLPSDGPRKCEHSSLVFPSISYRVVPVSTGERVRNAV